MRADDDEVKWFYDLLGWAIVDARAKTGDENYLAFLCNARTLFCKVYDFLNPEDDLKKVKKRIDEVKKQIANGNAPWSVIRNPLSVKKKSRNRKIIKSSNRKIINGEMEESPEIVLDDLLMFADWKLKHKDYKTAGTNYYLASLIATGTFANLEYDGTTAKNAAIIGMINSNFKNQKSEIRNLQLNDASFRSAELTLKLYLSATNDEQRAEYNTEAAMDILPQANSSILKFIQKEFVRNLKMYNFDKLLKLYNNYDSRTIAMPFNMQRKWYKVNIAVGKTKESFQIAINNLIHKENQFTRLFIIDFCVNNYSWADKVMLNDFLKVACNSVIFIALYNPYIGLIKIGTAINNYPDYVKTELKLRNLLLSKNIQPAYNCLINECQNVRQAGYLLQKSQIMLCLGKTDDAFNAAYSAYLQRNKLCKEIGGIWNIYPTFETELMEASLQLNQTNILLKYSKLLHKCEKKALRTGFYSSLKKIKNSVYYNY